MAIETDLLHEINNFGALSVVVSFIFIVMRHVVSNSKIPKWLI